MVNRLKWYKRNRKIHFISSILVFTFSFMYIITGFVTSKHEWFTVGEDVKHTQNLPLHFVPDTTNLKKLGRELKREFDLNGRMDYTKNKKGDISFRYIRPGIVQHVLMNNDLDSLVITHTERKTLYEINKRVHRVHGFQGGVLYFIWGILLDLTALSMILFSVTGIVMWYRSRKIYTFGWPILIVVFVLGILVFTFLKF
ncbi:MAG: PepSY-associated TM helix domain-containing protein [Mariniphaga sp.]|nr:PepSY-associated TM helix domain-containing protein [Mariniphaga sp.]MDD4225277.1 PepSY-associated TM helix domain-containing protein [Mariniphaga sp.]